MSMPYYVAPEQVMKDRADYARKGIARGRSLVATQFADGIAIVAENPSTTLRKVSEIYDRIALLESANTTSLINSESQASEQPTSRASPIAVKTSTLGASAINTHKSSGRFSPTR